MGRKQNTRAAREKKKLAQRRRREDARNTTLSQDNTIDINESNQQNNGSGVFTQDNNITVTKTTTDCRSDVNIQLQHGTDEDNNITVSETATNNNYNDVNIQLQHGTDEDNNITVSETATNNRSDDNIQFQHGTDEDNNITVSETATNNRSDDNIQFQHGTDEDNNITVSETATNNNNDVNIQLQHGTDEDNNITVSETATNNRSDDNIQLQHEKDKDNNITVSETATNNRSDDNIQLQNEKDAIDSQLAFGVGVSQRTVKRKYSNTYDSQHEDGQKDSKSARLEKRRLQYREKYHKDEAFRKKKLEDVKERYYRQYRTNKEYRLKEQRYKKELYKHDKSYKETKKLKSKTRYKDNVQHQQSTKQASISKYRDNPQHRQAVKRSSTSKYRDNFQHCQLVKQSSISKYRDKFQHRQAMKRASILKYKTDFQFQQSVKSASKKKYRTNTEFREQLKAKYSKDHQYRTKVKTLKRLKYSTDHQYRTKVKTLKRLKYSRNAGHRLKVLFYDRQRYKSNPTIRQKKIQSVQQARLSIKDENEIVSSFRMEINNKPKYVCCVCQKFLWRDQCVVCKPEDYNTKASDSGQMATECITTKFLHTCTEQCDDECDIAHSYRGKLWICYTCHRTLLRGVMPPESQQNNLQLKEIPEELKDLNDVERHLLALRIPFMKIVPLPKGGQKGIMGPCISVPTEIQKTTKTLPRCDTDAELIRVKLKRKLPYKGHYKYQFVNTKRLKTAFDYLKSNNKWYKDITLDTSWENPVERKNDEDNTGDQNSDEDTEENVGNGTQDDEQLHTKKDTDTRDKENGSEKMEGAPVDTCLQPDDIGQEFLDQYFDDIFCVAPAENNTPVSMLKEDGNEAMSFPCLFPTGSSSFSDKRPVPLTPLRYFHNRLMNADSRFARDPTYIFYAQYVAELQQVVSSVSIALRKGTDLDHHGSKITSNIISDKNSLNNILKNDQGYKFLKPVRGTPPYWQVTMKDLFAMIRQKGIPTWFCTFSAADMRWTEIIDTILKQQGSSETANDLDWTQKCEVLSSNPVMNAVMFNHRFNTFLKTVILSDLEPIGKVDDRFHRIEFQKRGSPHTHCTFWNEDSPKLDVDDDDAVCNFIDKYVTCQLPDKSEDEEMHEIVSSVQQHSKSHSKSCRKKGTTCRFHFPRPPSERTFISRPKSVTEPSSEKSPEQQINEAKQILQAIWDIILDPELDAADITTESLFREAGITQEQYEEASDIMTKRASIVLKRSPGDVWINQYNPTLLKCWNANMDMQYILDAYSCVMYIISYISKAERELGMVLEETRKEAVEGNLDAEQTMKKIGSSYFHQREVCIQEAVYRVCGLHLKECSCKVQFVPVGENPVKMSIPLHVIQSKSHQPDADIWMSSLSDKYKARPIDSQFDSLCYASFCSQFRILSPSQVPKNPSTTVHHLQNNLGCIQQRTRSKPAVVRYPRFVVDKNPEQYYQSILQLFLPHRNDQQLKPKPFKTYEEFYQSGAVKITSSSTLTSVSSIVDANRALFEKNADILDDARETMEKAGPLEDAWALLASEAEKDRLECQMEVSKSDDIQDDADDDIPDLSTTQKQGGQLEITKTLFTAELILPLMRSMNEQQKEVFYFVRQWCIDNVNGKKPAPFHLFITGGAGTGKSHLVKCLYYEVQKILSPSVPNPDDIVALLTAPTGTAAFNIGGATIHSAFSLTKYLSMPYKALRDESISSLRAKLQHLQILFIDEISMVDKKVLIYISERLRQIKMSKSKEAPFGNISVIVVGDFYQLPPVKQACLFKKDAREPVNLFADYFQIIELDEVMRQRDDAEFANMLNRFRVRKKQDPLKPEDVERLEQCEEKYYETEALHVFPTNAEVDEHNVHMAQKVCDIAFSIIAQDFQKDLTTGKVKRVETDYKPPQGCLPSMLFVGLGARVMLMRNLDVSDGLVNGVFGTVEGFLPPKEVDGLHEGIFVKFDNARVGSKLQTTSQSSHSAVLITPISEELGRRTKLRRQFPLQTAWACTVHKVQGMTTDAITVSLGKIFSPGQAYVALSRCTTMDGLMIRDLDTDKIYSDVTVARALAAMPRFNYQYNCNAVPDSVNIILHNIQGLYAHLKDLQSNTDVQHCEFLCLTETWLTEVDNLPDLFDFQLQNKPRAASYDTSKQLYTELKHQSHGGVGVYHRNNTKFVPVDLGVNNIEYTAFSIPQLNTTVVVIYRPETLPTAQFIQNLNALIQELQNRQITAILIGDFNENILKPPCPIQRFLKEAGYEQLVTESTTDGGTLIDHIYSNTNLCIKLGILPTYYSYHNMISVSLSQSVPDISF